MQDDILQAIEKVITTTDEQLWVVENDKPPKETLNQFVVFLKPEVLDTKSGVNLKGILDLVLGSLPRWNVEVRNVRVLGGSYLERHNLMGRHYGVINQISREGRSALTADAEKNLQELFKDQIAEGAEVLGGHQFLEAQPDFSAAATCTISDNLGVTKLGGGSYATPVKVLGKPYVILNAFHPQQLVPFYSDGIAIPVLECVSSTPWKELRQKLTGATNPLKAVKGSIRQQFLANKEKLGLMDVSQGANGIHLSAGPLEGMVELVRFMADEDAGHTVPIKSTAFGQLLESRGMTEGHIADLAMNPDLAGDEGPTSAFDLTEEIDAVDAADLLLKASAA